MRSIHREIITNYQIRKPKRIIFSSLHSHTFSICKAGRASIQNISKFAHMIKSIMPLSLSTLINFSFFAIASLRRPTLFLALIMQRDTRLPTTHTTTHFVFRSFGAWITITSSTFFHHTFPSS